MDAQVRQALVTAASNVQLREILTFFYRDHPQGASFDGLKEMLFLHDAFDEAPLRQLVEQDILVMDKDKYRITRSARLILDRDPTILMEEFLR